MTEQAEPGPSVWGEPFEGQLLEASGSDPAKVVALEQAVDLVKELHPIILTPETAYEDLAQAAGSALAIAKEFEAYLTEDEDQS